MNEQIKPFACNIMECGMSFTNEDHLNVHRKKHDMILQFDNEQKSAYVADQTPTPTRFIRNCEEVGLFQELQNVNPFDEGFKKAMETRQGILLDHTTQPNDDVLHTPQNIFPNLENSDSTFYSSTNTKNISISRSLSHESGAKTGFETITKCTNEVTISRVINKDGAEKSTDNNKEIETVSFSNNIIKVNCNKDDKIPPIMSQKSIDRVFDSLTNDVDEKQEVFTNSKATTYKKPQTPKPTRKRTAETPNVEKNDYEVLIKLPTGKMVRMKAVEEEEDKPKTKEILKKIIKEKMEPKIPVTQNTFNIMQKGTLIPVTFVKPVTSILVPQVQAKVPIASCPLPLKKDTRKEEKKNDSDVVFHKLSKRAAVKRYREKLKVRQDGWKRQISDQSVQIHSLAEENAMLKALLVQHMEKCPMADDMKLKEKLSAKIPVKIAPALCIQSFCNEGAL